METEALPGPAAAAESITAPRGPSSPIREAWIVGRNEFRYLLLSLRTLAPMAIYAGFAALAVYAYLYTANRAREEAIANIGEGAAEYLTQKSQDITGAVLEFVGWGTKGDAAELFRDKVPLIVVFFFAISSYFLPLLVAVVTFDQFSELSTRGARFVLLRVRRGSYVAGKAVSAVAAVAAFLLVMWLVVVGVSIAHDGTETAPYAVREGLRGWALMLLLALPYLSVTALISSFVRPGLAFLLTLGAWVAMWIGGGIVNTLLPWMLNRWGFPSAADAERHLLAIFPWHHAPKLISRDGATLASGAGALLLLAAIGYLLTWFVVRRRDV
jgi:ABC-type transport system involved in multi-copper enzyme maturation permease subunit